MLILSTQHDIPSGVNASAKLPLFQLGCVELGCTSCADISAAPKRSLLPAGGPCQRLSIAVFSRTTPALASILQGVVFESYEKLVALPSGHKCSTNAEVLVIDNYSGEVDVYHSQGRLDH